MKYVNKIAYHGGRYQIADGGWSAVIDDAKLYNTKEEAVHEANKVVLMDVEIVPVQVVETKLY